MKIWDKFEFKLFSFKIQKKERCSLFWKCCLKLYFSIITISLRKGTEDCKKKLINAVRECHKCVSNSKMYQNLSYTDHLLLGVGRDGKSIKLHCNVCKHAWLSEGANITTLGAQFDTIFMLTYIAHIFAWFALIELNWYYRCRQLVRSGIDVNICTCCWCRNDIGNSMTKTMKNAEWWYVDDKEDSWKVKT